MGHKVCPVCHVKHDEVVLLDTRLREVIERDNFMGFKLCKEHAAMSDKYLALVEAIKEGRGITLTGNACHIKWHAAEEVLGVKDKADPFVWVEPGVIAKLQSMTEGEGA
jgi:hypothetical protein